MSGSLYVDGARIGTAIGEIAKRVRVVVDNVRDYFNGIEDAARAASNPKGDGDDGRDSRDD